MSENKQSNKWRSQTQAVRIQLPRSEQQEHTSALYLTSSYAFDTAEQAQLRFAKQEEGNIYGRYTNPNNSELVAKMCALEKAPSGIAVATGMAAIFTTFAALLSHGDHIIASRCLFGSTYRVLNDILPKWGINVSYIDATQQENWETELNPQTKLVFIETPTNPSLEVTDLEQMGSWCKSKNLLLVVDNCIATPILQQPYVYGADLVVHSATKYIDGQGRVLGGVIVGHEELINKMQQFIRHTGPTLSSFNAWLLSKSLEHLEVRMLRHCANALSIATFLTTQPQVYGVKYPYLPSHPQYNLVQKQMSAGGGIVTFRLKRKIQEVHSFINSLGLFTITANLGDTRSIVTHPATTTHSSLSQEERNAIGVTDDLIRLSIGLEDEQDLQDDLYQALIQL